MEQTTGKKEKGSFFSTLAVEFKKIIWPTKESAARQTIAVVVVAAILGVIVSFLDTGITALIGLIS